MKTNSMEFKLSHRWQFEVSDISHTVKVNKFIIPERKVLTNHIFAKFYWKRWPDGQIYSLNWSWVATTPPTKWNCVNTEESTETLVIWTKMGNEHNWMSAAMTTWPSPQPVKRSQHEFFRKKPCKILELPRKKLKIAIYRQWSASKQRKW